MKIFSFLIALVLAAFLIGKYSDYKAPSDLKVKEQDAVIFINKAGIKLPYLPTVYFNIENPQKLDYNKTSIVFSNISCSGDF